MGQPTADGLPRFRPLVCAHCARRYRVLEYRCFDGSWYQSPCFSCKRTDWLDVELHPPLSDIEALERLDRSKAAAKRMKDLRERARRMMFRRDPDSPEAQDWWYDDDE